MDGSGKSRAGRPARIDREAIARTVLDLGLAEATMARVAERLGVTVPALYHYVRGREDLALLAAEHKLRDVQVPIYAGQDWATWLRQWARIVRNAMSQFPELIDNHTRGGLAATESIEAVSAGLDGLAEQGFTPEDALIAWDTVMDFAIGAAVDEVREQRSIDSNEPIISRVHAFLARRPQGADPTLQTLVRSGHLLDYQNDFETKLTIVLLGIAARSGREASVVANHSAASGD